MMKISATLQILDDGNWHRIDEVQKSSGFSSFSFDALIDFLDDFSLITIDTNRRIIKVKPDFQELLIKTK